MSGHNKWSKIKHKKGAEDAKKSKLYSVLVRQITMEVKAAKGDASSPRVRTLIDKARAVNMPNENIERAIKKATDNSAVMEAITYESYGPGGCAMIIEALTDNRNKAAQEIKFILSKHGFELAGMGSATWAFAKEGVAWKPTTTVPLEEADLELLAKLVEELEDNDEVQEVFTNAE